MTERRVSETLATVLLVSLSFVLGCSEFVMLGVEPAVAEGLGVPLSDVGDLVGRFALVYAVCTPILGITTGRFRRYALLVAYLAVFNVGNLLAGLASSYGMLYLARVLTASVSGSLLACAMTFVPDLVRQERQASVISLIYAGFSIASVLGVPAGTMLCGIFGWNVAFLVVFALGLAVSVALLAVLPRTGSTDEPATVAQQLEILSEGRVLLNIALVLLGAAGTYVFYTYITAYLETLFGMTAAGVSAFLVVVGVATVISNLSSGVVASRWGVRGLLPGYAAQALLLAGLFVTRGSLALCLANIFCIGVVMYLSNSPCTALFLEVASNEHPHAMTFASALQPMSFNIGIALGSSVGGVVVNGPGLALVGPVGAALAVGAFAVCLALSVVQRRVRA